MDWWKFAGIVVAIVVPIGLAIYAAGRARGERNEKRLDEHIVEDVKAHERIVRLETKIERLEGEVGGIRKRMHDFFDGLKRGDWELIEARYDQIKAELAAFKAEVLRLIGK